jgi:hypothetical protein
MLLAVVVFRRLPAIWFMFIVALLIWSARPCHLAAETSLLSPGLPYHLDRRWEAESFKAPGGTSDASWPQY